MISDAFTTLHLVVGAVGIVVVLTARFIGVSLPITIMSFTRTFEPRTIAILTWGGLRGGISVALALSLAEQSFISEPVKDIIISTTYCVVVFSILVQGLTIGKLLKK